MSWQALLLAAVHDTPGIARAEAARQLGVSSGLATETTARLVSSGLLAERPGLFVAGNDATLAAVAEARRGAAAGAGAPLGRDLLELAGEPARQACLAGLMAFRAPAPLLIPARMGDEAPLVGAAEEAFCLALSDEGLKNWATRDHREDRWS